MMKANQASILLAGSESAGIPAISNNATVAGTEPAELSPSSTSTRPSHPVSIIPTPSSATSTRLPMNNAPQQQDGSGGGGSKSRRDNIVPPSLQPSAIASSPQPSAPNAKVKPRVGDYELGDTIGSGASCKVKKCIHLPTGEEWVAKIIPIRDGDVETDVHREILILRRLSHPNIVRLKEILQSARNFYIILEAVTGGDLCSLLIQRDDGLTEAECARYFSQLVDGLVACHERGVAHRDLKPENLLLTDKNEIKISDFGLSRLHKTSVEVARAEEYAQTMTGTLAYISPEVFTRHYDAFLADIWSLGCILYVLLTCRFPFGPATGQELEQRIRQCQWIPLPPTVSPLAADLVQRLIVKDPAARPSAAEIRRHPFLLQYSNPGVAPLFQEGSIRPDFPHVDDPAETGASGSPRHAPQGMGNGSFASCWTPPAAPALAPPLLAPSAAEESPSHHTSGRLPPPGLGGFLGGGTPSASAIINSGGASPLVLDAVAQQHKREVMQRLLRERQGDPPSDM